MIVLLLVYPFLLISDESVWNAAIPVYWNTFKIHFLSVSLTHFPCSPQSNSDSTSLHPTESFSLFGWSINHSCWSTFVSTLTSRGARKVGFLFRAEHSLAPAQPLLHCIHVWGAASSIAPSLFDRVEWSLSHVKSADNCPSSSGYFTASYLWLLFHDSPSFLSYLGGQSHLPGLHR